MKSFFIKLISGIVLLFSGWEIADYGDKLISKSRLQQYTDLCNNADSTFGVPKDSVSVMTLKYKSAKTDVYTIAYVFSVSGKQYVSSISSTTLTIKDSVKIWFDKKNPASNSTVNPCTDLQHILKTKHTGSQWPFYLTGVLLLLLGFSLTMASIKGLIRSLFQTKK